MTDSLGLFATMAGFVIGLGAVTVIDLHGFLGRKSAYWTEATTRTHKVTKPMIWVGIALAAAGMAVLYKDLGWIWPARMHAALGALLVLNGLYLSFKVSPFMLEREKQGKQAELLPAAWQRNIAASLVLSVIGWWGSLALFAWVIAGQPAWTDRVPVTGAQAKRAAVTDPRAATYVIDGVRIELSGSRVTEFRSDDGVVKEKIAVFNEPTYGDLDGDGDEDALFILTRDAGGSGTFYYAVAAALNSDGSYAGTDAILLGDRIAPQTVEVREGMGYVNYAVRAEGEDFTVRPSFGKTLRVTVDASDAVAPVMVVHQAEDETLSRLRSKTWTWTGTQMNDGSATVPRQSDAFTMTLGADGRAAFTTDCNSMSGSYEAGDARIAFGPLAATRMYCEGSQETEFAAKLAEVQSYLFDGDRLVLEIKYDSGTMTFK